MPLFFWASSVFANKCEDTKMKKLFAWIVDTVKWLFDLKDWKMLLRSIPAVVVALFTVCTVTMNLAANKIVWSGVKIGQNYFISSTGGVFLSWAVFLIMDMVTKTFGAKASIKLNLFGAAINAIAIIFLGIIASVPSDFPFPGASSSFDAVLGFTGNGVQPWQILISSTIAYIASGIINSIVNVCIGRAFKKKPDGKAAFATRSFISTIIGQFADNFIFTGIAFGLFAHFYGPVTILGMALLGALIELVSEIIFSPIAYLKCKKWQLEGVGQEYFAYCKKMELSDDPARFEFNQEN